jgi:hypothetical protein
VTAAVFNASNLTADSTDGWQVVRLYSSPYSMWEAATEASYNAANPITTAIADAADAADASDGWTADKLYAAPYTAYEALPSVMKYDKDILGKLIQPVGSPVTPLTDGSGNVTNAATANLYSVSNYALLNSGMQAIALAECGGTLTIQTRLTSGTSAQDPFTYQNSIDSKTVKTTGQFRGGTFDFETTGSVSPTITTQNLTDLTHYSPVSWACSAKGQPRAFTTSVSSDSPWPSITVTIAANEAVSCTQTVQWTP